MGALARRQCNDSNLLSGPIYTETTCATYISDGGRSGMSVYVPRMSIVGPWGVASEAKNKSLESQAANGGARRRELI